MLAAAWTAIRPRQGQAILVGREGGRGYLHRPDRGTELNSVQDTRTARSQGPRPGVRVVPAAKPGPRRSGGGEQSVPTVAKPALASTAAAGQTDPDQRPRSQRADDEADLQKHRVQGERALSKLGVRHEVRPQRPHARRNRGERRARKGADRRKHAELGAGVCRHHQRDEGERVTPRPARARRSGPTVDQPALNRQRRRRGDPQHASTAPAAANEPVLRTRRIVDSERAAIGSRPMRAPKHRHPRPSDGPQALVRRWNSCPARA